MAGHGLEDSINCLIDEVRNSLYKQRMGVFLEISGAFNCANWHEMLEEVDRATDDRCNDELGRHSEGIESGLPTGVQNWASSFDIVSGWN